MNCICRRLRLVAADAPVGLQAHRAAARSGRGRRAARRRSSSSASPSDCSSCEASLRRSCSARCRRVEVGRRPSASVVGDGIGEVGAGSHAARGLQRVVGIIAAALCPDPRCRRLTPIPHMPSAPRSLSPSDFAYSRERFRELVDGALAPAKALGASDAVAEVSEGVGLSVSVRKGETENVERNRDKSLGVTVYVGQRRGNASTSDFSRAAHRADGARRLRHRPLHGRGPAAGLPDADDLAAGAAAARDLDLFHPWAIDAEAGDRAGAGAARPRRSPSTGASPTREGAGVSAQQSHFFAANTRGFAAATPARATRSRSRRSPRCRQGRRRHAARRLVQLDALGRRAGRAGGGRPLRRRAGAVAPEVAQDHHPRSARCCSSRRSPPGCSAPTCRPTSGGALYRKARSCWTRSASACSPEHLDVREDPHVPRGKGSAPFDDEGVRDARRARSSTRASCEGYFLSQLLGAQARHEDHRPRRRLAQPDADLAPDQARRRPRRDAAQARHAACS